jgi:hypothetical protein
VSQMIPLLLSFVKPAKAILINLTLLDKEVYIPIGLALRQPSVLPF